MTKQTLVYAVLYRKPLGAGWELDSIHASRKLALLHILELWENDEGYDFKIEEHLV